MIDGSKHLRRILSLDVVSRRCVVETGIVLDDLNRQLKPHGLWFPVDISTASRATIGGMAGNNSCGGRSLRYGTMRDNVLAIDAVLADGANVHFGEVAADLSDLRDRPQAAGRKAVGDRRARGGGSRGTVSQRSTAAWAAIISTRSIRANNRINLAHVLVGSEGTLAYSTAIS